MPVPHSPPWFYQFIRTPLCRSIFPPAVSALRVALRRSDLYLPWVLEGVRCSCVETTAQVLRLQQRVATVVPPGWVVLLPVVGCADLEPWCPSFTFTYGLLPCCAFWLVLITCLSAYRTDGSSFTHFLRVTRFCSAARVTRRCHRYRCYACAAACCALRRLDVPFTPFTRITVPLRTAWFVLLYLVAFIFSRAGFNYASSSTTDRHVGCAVNMVLLVVLLVVRFFVSGWFAVGVGLFAGYTVQLNRCCW